MLKIVTKVVTYQAGEYGRINLTPRQELMLRKAGVWPRNYVDVYYGLHRSEPTYTDADIVAAIATGRLSDHVALV